MGARTTAGATQTALSESAIWTLAARSAWAYVDAEYQPKTGLVNSVRDYRYATVWDIASGLAALYCADQLDLIAGDDYDLRMRRALKTISGLALYDDAAFNKNYHTDTGRPAGRDDRDNRAAALYGWSALDIGRLLTWLRIIETNQPQYKGEIETIVRRLDMKRLVVDGYLQMNDLNPVTGAPRVHQEGKIGYEQYAAHGYSLWGHKPEKALDFLPNTTPFELWGETLRYDWRGDSHLTSEPFVMLGMELGWRPEERELAWRVLSAQRERHRRTGRVTFVSEDAMPESPHFFFYYSVLGGRSGTDTFAVNAVNASRTLDSPRWVSAKAALAWHALLPSDYTMLGVRTVLPAMSSTGWASGVYENTQRSTGAYNVNTAAVILTAAVYVRVGRPLLDPARTR